MEPWAIALLFTLLAAIIGLFGVMVSSVIKLSRIIGKLAAQVENLKVTITNVSKHVCPYPGGCPLLEQDRATRAKPRYENSTGVRS